MLTIPTATGSTVSYSVAGSGPPLVLVHGAFSDHETNWAFVAPLLRRHVHASTPSRGAAAERPTPRSITPWKTRRRTSLDGHSRRLASPWPCSAIRTAPTAPCSPRPVQPHRVTKLVLYEPAWPEPDSAGRARGARDAGGRRRLGSVRLRVLRERAARPDRGPRRGSRLGRSGRRSWPTLERRSRIFAPCARTIRPDRFRGPRRPGAAADRIREPAGLST